MIFSKPLDQRLLAARKYVLAVGVVVMACITPSFVQGQQLTRPKIEAKAIYGGVVFGEDDDHQTVGASVRVYVTKRLSVEPEYLYLWHGENDQDAGDLHPGLADRVRRAARRTRRRQPRLRQGAPGAGTRAGADARFQLERQRPHGRRPGF